MSFFVYWEDDNFILVKAATVSYCLIYLNINILFDILPKDGTGHYGIFFFFFFYYYFMWQKTTSFFKVKYTLTCTPNQFYNTFLRKEPRFWNEYDSLPVLQVRLRIIEKRIPENESNVRNEVDNSFVPFGVWKVKAPPHDIEWHRALDLIVVCFVLKGLR